MLGRRLRLAPVWWLSIGMFAISVAYSFSVYRQFRAGYDLGIFDQAVAHYSRFQAPLAPLKGPRFNILGDHFHPILAVLAPLYWIVDDPRVLLVAQAALVSASIPIVHRFAARRRSAGQALAVAAGYAIGWPLQAMIKFDFHEVAFAVVLVAWVIDSLDRLDDPGLLASCALLVLVREDMGILVVAAGLVRLAAARRPAAGRRPPAAAGQRAAARRRWLAIALIAGGIAMYWVSTDVVLPHLASTGHFQYWTYDALGADPAAAITSILTRPWHAARLFFTPAAKTRTLVLLLVPLAFLPLRSRYLLLALPVFAEQFFTSRQALWTTEYYYWALIWPILTMAAIDGAAAAEWRKRRVGAAAPLTFAVVGTCLAGGLFPFHDLLDGSAFGRSAHVLALQQAVDSVPAGTCVVTDDRIAVHLAATNLVSLPGRLGRAADFTVLDLTRSETGYDMPTPQSVLQSALKQGDQLVFSRQHVVVLRAAGYHGPSPSCRP